MCPSSYSPPHTACARPSPDPLGGLTRGHVTPGNRIVGISRNCCQYCCPNCGQRLTRVDDCGISAQRMDRDGRSWTMCPLLRIRCSHPRCGPDRAVMLADTKRQAGKLICARICAQDAAGRAETGETQRPRHERPPSVRRGQRGDQRRSETAETHVVWLITQRSRVQIPPPLPSLQVRGLFRSWKGPSACAVCTELCTRPLRRAAAAAGR